MPITTACSCGKTFAAKDEFAGRQVKCPACGDLVAIPQKKPNAGITTTNPTAGNTSRVIRIECQCGKRMNAPIKVAGKSVKCPECGQAILVPADGKTEGLQGRQSNGVADLLDEVGVHSTKTGLRCPMCRADMNEDDILCIQCGYNLETGKKVATKVEIKKKGHRGPYSVSGAAAKGEGDVVLPPPVASLVKIMTILGVFSVIVCLLIAVVVFSLASLIAEWSGVDVPTGLLIPIFVFLLILAAPYFVTSHLLQKQSEAGRILAIVMGILSLPGFPILTILGILILKHALSPEAKDFCRKKY